MSTNQTTAEADFDVIIIGAGISGINAAYRIQTQLPNATYTILEARDFMGGTWDLFRFPGVRSDSDLHTFGFQWWPWQDKRAFADGDMILDYMRDAASSCGIDKRIQYQHKLLSADWSSTDQLWNLQVEVNSKIKTVTSHFCIMGTGYYDYSNPLDVEIPGLDNFKGTVVHPQFWPEDLDYSGKNMVIIGSGATAVTLLPTLAETAAHVTMLQRSPSYILVRSTSNLQERLLHATMPRWLALKLIRWTWIILPWIFFRFCRTFPAAARSLLLTLTKHQLPADAELNPDWTPSYNPWEQRLCTSPDALFFFEALKKGKSDVVTGTISTVSANAITLADGRTLHPDIIVTATGLRIVFAGGVPISIDGQKIVPPNKYVWKGMMVQDVPNMTFPIGYTHSSWTLGADATAIMTCRLIKHMQAKNVTSAVPRLDEGAQDMEDAAYKMSSTYFIRAHGTVPKGGNRGPWWTRRNLWADQIGARWGSLTPGIEFMKGAKWGVSGGR